MNDAKLIALAKQAGFADDEGTVHAAYPLKAFATLVMANVDPKSYTSWQEGYDAGRQKREWVGLEPEDLAQIESDEFWQTGNHMAIALAVEAKLKEKNDH